ncbi:MAG: GNAT family N-acetyltransferase [Methanobacteriaceae archaeon]|jgi:ribosomal protein S18 acetylase RimI-like enzyme|nr:MAG: GNAT family N-acetyltransferase [Methanobacterium sp. BRmetb2]MCC7558049.1 GNAT family N-acetyltransferase [Methanobacteriaceae archaeon]
MSYFRIKKLEKEDIQLFKVRKFLFNIIEEEFGYGYIPEYHKDIKALADHYIYPMKNQFYMAIHNKTQKVIGTLGIRSYDKNFEIFDGVYQAEDTASIWRVFVDNRYRRNGVASSLVKTAEKFCENAGYKQIYLHTHKTVQGSVDFWISKGYKITEDTNNELGTVHMEKLIL